MALSWTLSQKEWLLTFLTNSRECSAPVFQLGHWRVLVAISLTTTRAWFNEVPIDTRKKHITGVAQCVLNINGEDLITFSGRYPALFPLMNYHLLLMLLTNPTPLFWTQYTYCTQPVVWRDEACPKLIGKPHLVIWLKGSNKIPKPSKLRTETEKAFNVIAFIT